MGGRNRLRAAYACTWQLAAVVLSNAETARACPDCEIGRIARAQVWSDFSSNHAVALVPFVIVIVAAVWADGIGRTRSNSSHS
jgi:hypothetical protein